jgi:hypothetical protein
MDRPESHVARQYARLDEQGFSEASELVTALLDRLAEIEQESAKRLDAHEAIEVPTTLIAMLFDAPDLGPRAAGHEGAVPARQARATSSA